MLTREFQVTFLTPAFLGDAEQNGRWRTPPFKAQLRQWWRVAYAVQRNFKVNLEEMRRQEGQLFGNAWLEGEFRQSQVRLRLDSWAPGRETKETWGHQELKERISHPEAGAIGPKLYLGYGPLTVAKVEPPAGKSTQFATVLNRKCAIQAGESALLLLAYPDEHASGLEFALSLMHRYGTVGGRSRNGWGSYELSPSPPGRGGGGEGLPLRPWGECLGLDWPHAIGTDEQGPLIWQTAPHDDWKTLMRTLAIIKIGLRTQFRFANREKAQSQEKRNAPKNEKPPEKRHWLSYPVTNHDVAGWGGLRLPNSLRFKVRKSADGRLVGVIFHMPCSPPATFKPDRNTLKKVWECVHKFLDVLCRPSAQRDYSKTADPGVLARQAEQLAQVSLLRAKE